ncbi:MAG TPA: 4-hydroxy-3-methylbut-2-enyl diphosphate reductase [Verrucomicrobiae bacterium]
MKILRAEHLGMCFGVRDAIELALDFAARQPLTILGELVHNETVLDELRARGIELRNEPGEVETQTVMITAHGASDKRVGAVRTRGLTVLEATCPLVHAAHRAVAELARQGFHPVIIGKRDHVEVRGLTEDLTEFDVVLTEDDVLGLQPRARFGVAAQTTQRIEHVRHLVALIRRRFPQSEVRFVDTVCQPTKLRQHAAVELAARCDVVVVIGGAHSNNTRELVNTCRRYCNRVHHVQSAEDLRAEWFAGAGTVGLTAGTSTPDSVIANVESRLQMLTAAGERVPELSGVPVRQASEHHVPLHAA